jgi:GNAT superfamily N-acetyltransferase
MQLVTYDDVRGRRQPALALLHMASFGEPMLPKDVDYWRKGGFWADYVGIFAVEGREVLGQTFVLRLPFRFPDGAGTIAGIAAVTTRADAGGRGIARRILQEVHERERSHGSDGAALWTNRSWAAHGVYERLGYRDIYRMPSLVSFSPASRTGSGALRVRKARRSDLAAMEELHTRTTRGRLGFTPRTARFLQADAALLGAEAFAGYHVATQNGRLVGYLHTEVARGFARSAEVVYATKEAARALVARLNKLAAKKWAVLTMSVVPDLRPLLPSGYTHSDTSWYVLMGCFPGRTLGERAMTHAFGADDPRWVCMRGDRF